MTDGDRLHLPQGLYDAHLITDGSPTAVTLREVGTNARAHAVKADRRSPAKLLPLPEFVSEQGRATYSSGRTLSLRSRSFVALSSRVVVDHFAWLDVAYCLYDRRPPVPDELAFNTACDELGAEWEGWMVGPGAPIFTGVVGLVGAWSLPRGTWGLGVYSNSIGVHGFAESVVLRVPY